MSTWKDRAIAATKGRFHCILLSVLHRDTEEQFPRFGRSATITSDGFVICDFWDHNGDYHGGAFVGAMSDINRNREGLAKHLDLNIMERADLDTAFARWFKDDWRTYATTT